ncbi:MAG TPA: IS1182 family transposase [Streptosporangiaceae bacterium]|nr:IS1182 family transposase [Streptosporangiaceae bacterium]
MEPAAVRPGGRAPVVKTFRRFEPDQVLLLPPSLADWLPEGHLARFVAELVDEVVDLDPFYADDAEGRGFPPHDPRLMVRLLIYGYISGVRSSRAIERRCVDDVGFRFLAAGQVPDFRSIAKFRRRHLAALAGLLLQSLRLAQRMGMARLGRVALDGVKLRAAASKHKAMSYDRLVARQEQLETEIADLEARIAAMLAEAESVDAAEDARLGADRRDEDLPAELARREARLAKVAAAMSSLQAEAADQARVKAEARERARQARSARRDADGGDDEGAQPGEVDQSRVRAVGQQAAEAAAPEPSAQRNFTDPDSRIMKNSDGAFIQAYNGQAVVDEDHQIIVAADVTTCASDVGSLLPMLDQAAGNAGHAPAQALADAGYCSADNLAALADRQAGGGCTEVLVATGRLPHGRPAPPPDELLADTATFKERMAHRLRTDPGRAAYARRKVIVEPVFGQLATLQSGKRLLLRGQDLARGEWRLLAGCHNFRKPFRGLGSAGRLTTALP